VTTATTSNVCVRPAWGPDAPPLSQRAAALLVAEWRALGLLDDQDETDPVKLLQGVQQRAGAATTASRGGRPALKLVTQADPGADLSAPEADWPTFTGRLLTYGETAIIGKDSSGHYTRERFRPGSLAMPEDGVPVLVNRGHERTKVVGHLTGVSDVGDEVHVRGIFVDSVQDGYEACELARAGSVQALSVEFLPLGPPHTTITREASGGQLVEHSKVMLIGCALVPQPAYRSARLLRLLDRTEAGREREGVRQRHLATLTAADRRAKAVDARINAQRVLGRTPA
jgi:hypothetical protein